MSMAAVCAATHTLRASRRLCLTGGLFRGPALIPSLATLGPSGSSGRATALWHRSTTSSAEGSTVSSADGSADDGEKGPEGPGDALVPGGVRLYRRQRAEHQRTFKWGIGSKFRMESANRFTPVHKPHPMNNVVRDDYYDSDNPSVVWEDLREGWEVYWYENHKLTAKPFPVKKYGIERSKSEAFAFYEELKVADKLGQRPKIEQPQDGVFYDQRMQSWVCFFHRDGRPHSRCFAATKFGFEGAKSLAIAKQNDPVGGVLQTRGGGGTPLALKEKGKTPQELKYKGGPTGGGL